MTIPDEVLNWVIIPILIFLSRLVDVTLATLRNIFIHKGFRKIVPFIGFFEVLIWLIAMKQVLGHVDNAAAYFAWAAGFATGTYVGMRIEERLALGNQVIRIITSEPNSDELIKMLRDTNHGLTVIDGMGAKGPVKLLFTIVQRKHIKDIIEKIEVIQPNAFYTIEDVRSAEHGVFHAKSGRSPLRNLFSGNRK
ncbi:MAG TPA: DUF5698 domain-containing protein [Bacteroidia bacterium]|nr:DUF5698 domain-containing protein [Bacteroidia bacterium]